MAEYNLICANCLHGPHVGKKCTACNVCEQFIRPDVQVAYAVTQLLTQSQKANELILDVLSMTFELLAQQFPEAKDKMMEALIAARQKREDEAKAQQEALQKDVEAAYQQAVENTEGASENVVCFPPTSD